jgi:hypothetical protein
MPRFATAAVSYVDVDNVQGARSAVEHLIETGRKVIGTISGPPDMSAGLDRLAGYRQALDAAGIARDGSLETTADFSQQGGADAMRRILEVRPDVDAVFAASDLMAASERAPRPGRRCGRRLRRFAGRGNDRSTTDERSPADRGDGGRDGPRPPRARGSSRIGPEDRDSRDATRAPAIKRGGEEGISDEGRQFDDVSRPGVGGDKEPWTVIAGCQT